jgi:hypothetical protein
MSPSSFAGNFIDINHMGIPFSQIFPPRAALTDENLPSQKGKVFNVTGGYSGVVNSRGIQEYLDYIMKIFSYILLWILRCFAQ